jgi:hypothetical protein
MFKALAALVAVQLMCSCAPGEAGAISLKTKHLRGRPGVNGGANLQRCGDYICESGETNESCPRDCFTNVYSASIDSSTERFECTDPWSANYTKLTVSFWWKYGGTLVGFRGLHAKSQATGGRATEWLMQTDSGGTKLRLFVGSIATNFYTSTNALFAINTWYHVVWVYDGALASGSRNVVYINGASVPLTLSAGSHTGSSITDGTSTIEIGAYDNGTGTVESGGNYDSSTIWQYALSQTQVTALYNGGVPANPYSVDYAGTPPMIHYTFGDAALDDFDASGSSELLVDIIGGQNCTPLNTDAGDKAALVPPN